MDIYSILKTDHKMVIDVIDAIEKVTDTDRRKDLFSFMRTELVMHSKAEEEVLYRPLRALTNDGLLIESSFDDHHQIERLLGDIQTTSAKDASWIEKVRELRGVLQRHVMKEETDLFHLAREQFSAQEAEDIGIRMMEEKGKLGMENPLTVMSRKVKEMVE